MSGDRPVWCLYHLHLLCNGPLWMPLTPETFLQSKVLSAMYINKQNKADENNMNMCALSTERVLI